MAASDCSLRIAEENGLTSLFGYQSRDFMVFIAREEAICKFYGQEYNERNVTKLTKELDSKADVDICYFEDPLSPVLMSKQAIQENPKIHKYERITLIEKKPVFSKAIWIALFLNMIYQIYQLQKNW